MRKQLLIRAALLVVLLMAMAYTLDGYICSAVSNFYFKTTNQTWLWEAAGKLELLAVVALLLDMPVRWLFKKYKLPCSFAIIGAVVALLCLVAGSIVDFVGSMPVRI